MWLWLSLLPVSVGRQVMFDLWRPDSRTRKWPRILHPPECSSVTSLLLIPTSVFLFLVKWKIFPCLLPGQTLETIPKRELEWAHHIPKKLLLVSGSWVVVKTASIALQIQSKKWGPCLAEGQKNSCRWWVEFNYICLSGSGESRAACKLPSALPRWLRAGACYWQDVGAGVHNFFSSLLDNSAIIFCFCSKQKNSLATSDTPVSLARAIQG